jgi:8-oxo-dGTP diphosphatase
MEYKDVNCMETGKITIGNVCFIFDKKENKVLLLERYFEPMKGLLTGVGGKTLFEEDINHSCIREVKEETGFDVENVKLRGVVKTILDGNDSSWILFIYSTTEFRGQQINCPEGELKWIDVDDILNVKLIGFIKEFMPFILNGDSMIEGTIKHDKKGNVLEKKLILNS